MPVSYTHLYTYDALDRILTERTENQAQELVSENTYAYENISWDKSKVTVTPTGDGTITPAKTVKYYDNRGRLVQEDVADATTTYTTTYQYDYLENVVSMKNPRANAEGTGNTVAREYDYAGNVIQETNAAGKFTTTTYDMMGRKIAATDYNGNTAAIQYDSLGRQICTQTPFDGQNMSKTKNYYDPAGNLIRTKVQSNAPGEQESYHTTEYQYDVRGRLVAQTGIDGEIQNVVQYTYDNGGRILGMTTGLGQVSQSPMEEASAATTRYTYNEWNLPVTTTDPLGKTEQLSLIHI